MSSGGFLATHVAPPDGLQAWDQPDGARPVVANVQPGIRMQLVEQRGAWGRVLFSNGWQGWVDARRLVAVPPRPQPAPAPQFRPAEPPPRSRPAEPEWDPAAGAAGPAAGAAGPAAGAGAAAGPRPQPFPHPQPEAVTQERPRPQPQPSAPASAPTQRPDPFQLPPQSRPGPERSPFAAEAPVSATAETPGGWTEAPLGGWSEAPVSGTAGAPFGGTAEAPFGGTAEPPLGGWSEAPFGGAAEAPFGGTAEAPVGGTAEAPFGGRAEAPFGGTAEPPLGGWSEAPFGGAAEAPLGGWNEAPLFGGWTEAAAGPAAGGRPASGAPVEAAGPAAGGQPASGAPVGAAPAARPSERDVGPERAGRGRPTDPTDQTATRPRRSFPSLGDFQLGPAPVGAAVVLIGSLLPWIKITGPAAFSGNAFSVPLLFLVDYNAGSSSVKIGLLLVAAAVVAGVFCVLPGGLRYRRIAGGAAVAVALLYTFQLSRVLSEYDLDTGLFSAVRIGVPIVIAGGIAILVDRSEPPGG